MTLSKQLTLSGLFVLLCLFVGMITFVVKNTQSFLDQQLSSHSQDTATALGLCLTLTMKNNDLVTANRIVDAIWDRGYYQSIEIQSSKGVPMVQRTMEVKVTNVPSWFIELVNLKLEPKESLIMDGWLKVGKVIIKSNPGFAYQQIWQTFINCLEWFFITALIALFIGAVLLYIILKPLRAITAQAMAICNQQFLIQKTLPWTFDLRQVVLAMNNMSLRLKAIFEEQAKTTEEYRQQAYQDPITLIGNRRFFDLQFNHFLKDEIHSTQGVLFLIELLNFKEYNEVFGYVEGDNLLKNSAKVLKEHASNINDAVLSHAKGASFFMILPDKIKEEGQKIANDIIQSFKEFQTKGLSKKSEIGNIGLVHFKQGNDAKEVLSSADLALRAAQAKGPNQWHYIEGEGIKEIQGELAWNVFFDEILSNKKILLHFQETQLWVESGYSKLFEIFMRLPLKDGSLLAAGIFMPMASQLQKVNALDKLMIEKVINLILKGNHQDTFSINLSPTMLDDEIFKIWLLKQLKSLGKKSSQLMIELPEYGVINRIEKTRAFFLEFSALGGKTAIDNYGKYFNSFSYLYNLKINVLKIAGNFIRDIHQSQENQFFVRSLADIAHSLGITVIAESVQSKEEYLMLKQLKVDGVQGYYVAKPTEREN